MELIKLKGTWLAASFSVVVLLILTGCVGTKDDDGSVPYDPASNLTCDERGGCWSNCWDCAAEDECKTQSDACENDSNCAALVECIHACDTTGWDKCHDACLSYHGTQNSNYLALWNCVYCDVCDSSCSGYDFSCDTYAGYTPDTTMPAYPDLVWRSATLTEYESYPDPGSVECTVYNGCLYMGQFVYFGGATKPESWVQANNIVAIHSDDYPFYAGKTLRIRYGSNIIDAKVYDMCSDDDCDGCCTDNATRNGNDFLIDLEKHTHDRFTSEWIQTVEWACVDCN